MPRQPLLKHCAGWVMVLGLGACATTSAPQERLAASAGSVRAAEEVGAEKIPAAALYLQLAREEIEHAKGLMGEGQNERADWTLQRAEADAELAVLTAKNQPLVEKAKEVQDQLKAVKTEAAKQ